MALLMVFAGAVLLMAALDRLNKMMPGTRFQIRLAGWLLALSGGIGVLWPLASTVLQQWMPMLAIAGSALWLLADRRAMA